MTTPTERTLIHKFEIFDKESIQNRLNNLEVGDVIELSEGIKMVISAINFNENDSDEIDYLLLIHPNRKIKKATITQNSLNFLLDENQISSIECNSNLLKTILPIYNAQNN